MIAESTLKLGQNKTKGSRVFKDEVSNYPVLSSPNSPFEQKGIVFY